MANPKLHKSYVAEAVIAVYTIVKFGATDGSVVTAAAATDKLIGTAGNVAPTTGERVDVARSGIDQVVLGGTVARGDALTSNASGAAIATTTAGNRIIGFAEVSGVSGDVIDYVIAPGVY
mgnify:CR=1 FL=1